MVEVGVKVYLANSFDLFTEVVHAKKWTTVEAGRNLHERLECIEGSQLVLVNLDALNTLVGFDLGYAVARGKTLIGLTGRGEKQLPGLWQEVHYVVESLKDLSGALTAFDRKSTCPDEWHKRPGGWADNRSPCPTCGESWR